MSPAAWWALAAIFGSATVTVVTAFVVEELTYRRRERRETAAKLAAQQPPAVDLDPVDAHFATAAALLQPDALDADVAAVIRQAEAITRHAAGDVTDIPIIPGDQS